MQRIDPHSSSTPVERAPGTRQKASSRPQQPPLLLLGVPHCLPPFPTGAQAVCVCKTGADGLIRGKKCEHAVAFPIVVGLSIVPQHMEGIVILPGGSPLPGRRQLGRLPLIQPGSFELKWLSQTDRASCSGQETAPGSLLRQFVLTLRSSKRAVASPGCDRAARGWWGQTSGKQAGAEGGFQDFWSQNKSSSPIVLPTGIVYLLHDPY